MTIKKWQIMIFVAVAALLVSCNTPTNKRQTQASISEESLGLRKTNIYTENGTTPDKTKYTEAAPMTSTKFPRAFENAPPMIPHNIEGMLPITLNSNQCMGCHMPEIASSVGAVAIPASHFSSFRPKTKLHKDGSLSKNGKKFRNSADIVTTHYKLASLSPARTTCTQCHAPQSQSDIGVANEFAPHFRNQKDKQSSNLIDNINEGVE